MKRWITLTHGFTTILTTFAFSILQLGHAQEATVDGDFRQECSEAVVGDTVVGTDGFIEYRVGANGLIIAAPHGGRKKSDRFPVRSNGVIVTDSSTDLLAKAVADKLRDEHQVDASLVICHLQRKYLDPNRPLEAACSEDSGATQIWREYQAAIESSKQRIVATQGRGLFLEFHGHGHPNQRVELGYLLRKADFELPPDALNELASRSSVREMSQRGDLGLNALVRGELSLGNRLQEAGIAAVPSPQDPAPGTAPYFNGGWNTRQHGSRDGGTINSIQIEFHRPGIRDSRASVLKSAKPIAAAIAKFYGHHF